MTLYTSRDIVHVLTMAVEAKVDLYCSLCSRVYKNPRVLPCLHSFCEECLEKQKEYIPEQKQSAPHSQLVCPVAYCQMPAGRDLMPENLPRNLWLETRINVDTKLKELLDGTCEVCEERKKAETLCTECWTAMCSECTTSWHNRNRAYKTHTLVPLTEESSDTLKAMLGEQLTKMKPVFCSEHDEGQNELYCSYCRKPSCLLCHLNGKCKSHKYTSLSDVAQACKDKLVSSAQSLATPLKKLQDALGECKEVKENISARKREVEEEINTVFSELINTLTKQKEELLQECHAIAQSKSTRLDLQMDQLLRLRQQMEHCSEVISIACNSHNPTELLAMSETMVAHINSLNKSFLGENLYPCASAGINATFPSYPQLGNVSGACYPPLCVLEVPLWSPVECIVREEKQLQLTTHNEEQKKCSHGGDKVEATLTSRQTVTANTTTDTPVEVTDNHDGTYILSFTPHSVGEHQLAVKLNGCPVQGSPLQVNIKTECDEVRHLLYRSLQSGEQR